MIDPKAPYYSELDEVAKEVEKLKKEHPDTYFNHPEFRKLMERSRQAFHQIEHYQRMMDAGVKF